MPSGSVTWPVTACVTVLPPTAAAADILSACGLHRCAVPRIAHRSIDAGWIYSLALLLLHVTYDVVCATCIIYMPGGPHAVNLT